MKNWNTLDADINLLLAKHYTKGRQGSRIDKIILHHNAGNLSVRGCFETWQTRQASAHYQVESTGIIGQLVWDGDTAWHAGNWDANLTSIGIEHADVSSSPWRISDACLENGAHLVAALCVYYKLGRPEWGRNVYGHSHFSSTECPASIAGNQRAAYMARAGYWYDQMTGNRPAASKSAAPATANIDALADAVIRGEYGNGDTRRARLGGLYDAVQRRVNEKLGAGSNSGANIDALADAVIRGDYGNGDERRRRLGGLYDAVQRLVNQKLS